MTTSDVSNGNLREVSPSDAQRAVSASRMPMLDGLRGVAILCVLFEHFGGLPVRYFDFGYYGVDLFFVLSGFLITGILLRSGTGRLSADLWHFFGRRSLRIFPPYFMLLAGLFIFDYAETRTHILPLATYTWNYFCRDGGPFYLWSLSLEEQFYVFWPLVIFVLKPRRYVLMSIIVLLAVFSYWQILYSPVAWLTPYNYTGLPNRMGSLCAGAFGAWMVENQWRPAPWLKGWLLEPAAVAGIVWSMMCLSPAAIIDRWRLAYPVQAFCSLLLVLKCYSDNVHWWPLRTLLNHRLLIRLGMISYGVYLIHLPLGEWFRTDVFGPIWHSLPFEKLGRLGVVRWHSWIIAFPCCSVLSVAAAAFSWKYFESPILKYKDRWFPGR